MSASDARAGRRWPVVTALFAGWLVFVAELAVMFFVIPHNGAFAPEMGSSATFVVFAVLYSISYIGGFIALWLYMRLAPRFGRWSHRPYGVAAAVCLFAAVVVASARAIAGPPSGTAYEFVFTVPAGVVASIVLLRGHREHRGDGDRGCSVDA